jgi:hypothetical protein
LLGEKPTVVVLRPPPLPFCAVALTAPASNIKRMPRVKAILRFTCFTLNSYLFLKIYDLTKSARRAGFRSER